MTSTLNDFDTLTSQYSASVTTQPAVDALRVLTSDPRPRRIFLTVATAVNEVATVPDALRSDPQCD